MASNSVCDVLFVDTATLTEIDRNETLVSNHFEVACRQGQTGVCLFPNIDAKAT